MKKLIGTLFIAVSMFGALFTFTQQQGVSNLGFDSNIQLANDQQQDKPCDLCIIHIG